MSASRGSGPSWSTACFGDAVDTSPKDMSVLGQHLQVCRLLSGRWYRVGCAAEATRAFVSARFVTSLFVLMALAGLGALAW